MSYYGIKCGTLIDGTGNPALKNAVIIVKNNYIVRILKNAEKIQNNIPILDAGKCTVIPGLIDAHKHVMNCGGSGIGVGLNYNQIKANISTMAKGGVTSVLDLGSANLIPYMERIMGSNTKIFNAISILTCQGGYPHEYMPRKFYNMGSVVECGNIDEIRRTVRKLYKKGVAVIKTAVVSRTFDNKPQKNWTDKELQYLTDEAHSYGLNVCAHVTYAKDYEQAARCGIDSIHHAAFDDIIEERVLELMLEKGIIFVPTLSLVVLTLKGLQNKWIYQDWYQPEINKKIKTNLRNFTEAYFKAMPNEPIGDFFVKVTKEEMENIPYIQIENVRRYIRLGGVVAMGTDSALGFSLHNTPVCEIKLLMEAGLTLEKTIQAATENSAKVFGKENEIGTLEEKKRADILIIDGSLESDITNIDKIKSVIINGKNIYERDV